MGVTGGRPEPTVNGSAVSSFRDLRVWQAAMDLVESVYRYTRSFPRDEAFGLKPQVQRAAVSVPSNIAEGHAREHLREYLHHLSMAQGSLAEVDTQVEIASRLGYATPEQGGQLLAEVAAVARQLKALRIALERKLP
jgi:four helix bundle protein